MKNPLIQASLAVLMLTAYGPSIARGDKQAGAKKAEELCATCHAADGNGIDSTYPRLAGQYADYMEKALEDYRSGARKNAIMAGFAITLSDEDIENLSAYYAGMKGLKDLKIK